MVSRFTDAVWDWLPLIVTGLLVAFIVLAVYCSVGRECTKWGPAMVDDYVTTHIPIVGPKGGVTLIQQHHWVGRHFDPHTCLNYEWKH